MNLDDIKRDLRSEIKKRQNEQYVTFQTNIRQMCVDVLAKLEEQESEIAELKDKLQATEKQTENLINSASSLLLGQDAVNDKLDAKIYRLKCALWIVMAKFIVLGK